MELDDDSPLYVGDENTGGGPINDYKCGRGGDRQGDTQLDVVPESGSPTEVVEDSDVEMVFESPFGGPEEPCPAGMAFKEGSRSRMPSGQRKLRGDDPE